MVKIQKGAFSVYLRGMILYPWQTTLKTSNSSKKHDLGMPLWKFLILNPWKLDDEIINMIGSRFRKEQCKECYIRSKSSTYLIENEIVVAYDFNPKED